MWWKLAVQIEVTMDQAARVIIWGRMASINRGVLQPSFKLADLLTRHGLILFGANHRVAGGPLGCEDASEHKFPQHYGVIMHLVMRGIHQRDATLPCQGTQLIEVLRDDVAEHARRRQPGWAFRRR